MINARWRGAAAGAAALVLIACSGPAPSAKLQGTASPGVSRPVSSGAPDRTPVATPTLGIVAARSVDANGSPAGITSRFDRSKDRQVIVAVPSEGMPVGTTYSYVRSVGGRYLDSSSVPLTHLGRYVLFEVSARPGHSLVAGHFRYQIFRDRSLVGAVEYDVG